MCLLERHFMLRTGPVRSRTDREGNNLQHLVGTPDGSARSHTARAARFPYHCVARGVPGSRDGAGGAGGAAASLPTFQSLLPSRRRARRRGALKLQSCTAILVPYTRSDALDDRRSTCTDARLHARSVSDALDPKRGGNRPGGGLCFCAVKVMGLGALGWTVLPLIHVQKYHFRSKSHAKSSANGKGS